ncbi:GNAT family N-acetyltransferase [Kaistia defluvii]|uniref:GNAT family N-acetyltransferase n=1 Tax=Kaistia defluvii TaxID=410841 RepID=UPI00224E4157|nr:GNAT family N-acetyltransferase [Kaistia defluvii]MCX5520260.1 GNAT family N-acetyltransferase [Kaistia defluvii]
MDGADAQAPASSIAVADLDIAVHASPREIAGDWRALEHALPVSVYQSFDWIDCWIETATAPQRIRPVIVSIRHGTRLVAVLPLGIERVGPLRVARFLGGDHANIRMGLFDPDFAAALDGRSTPDLLRAVAGRIRSIDLFDLDAQPIAWAGIPNPLAVHTHATQARCDVGMMRLETDFASVLKAHRGAKKGKKHRWQANTLEPVGGFTLRRAGSQAEALAILDSYFAQKAAWFRSQGIADSFAEPGVADFFRALVRRRWSGGESALIELDALEFDGGIRAILGSGTQSGRLSGYFMSVSDDDWRRVSPGELMLYEVIAASCARGLQALDLGRGDERYKASWLDINEPHVRAIIPVTPAGRAAAALLRLADRTERAVRGNPRLWKLAKTIRRWRGRDEKTPADAE